MKKVVIFFLMLLILPLVFAVEFNVKENFNQGETFLAKISGNFVHPIVKENVLFYRGHVSIPADPYVAKINGDYYIYSLLLGKSPGNYSIAISNTKYYAGREIIGKDIVKNFSIIEDMTDFSINPGFVVTKKDFFIEVQNLQDFEIGIQINSNATTDSSEKGFFASLFGTEEISTESESNENSLILKSGEIKKIYFKANATQSKLYFLRLSSENSDYKIPVYIIVSAVDLIQKEILSFDILELDIAMKLDSNLSKNLTLQNSGNTSIKNISLSVSESLKPYLSLSSYEISSLKENSSAEITLILSSFAEEKSIEGYVTARNNANISISFPVYLTIINESVQIPESETEEEIPAISKTCAENNGTICNKTEECDGDSITAKDDKCCLGVCKKIEKSSKGKIIGWAITIILFGIFVWFVKFKYPKIKKQVNLLETAKEFLKGSKTKP